MVKESLRKFASGNVKDTGKHCGFLLNSFRKVCVNLNSSSIHWIVCNSRKTY